jgi:iron(III) transport system substrate-binding protein
MLGAFLLVVALAASAPPAGAMGPSGADRPVVIYSPLHEIVLQNLARMAFGATGLRVEFVRVPPAEVGVRLVNDRGQPQADVILGASRLTQEDLRARGLIDAYASPSRLPIPQQFRDADGYWTGVMAHVLGIIVNVGQHKRELSGAQIPRTWDDLLDPRYRSQIVVPGAATSGAGSAFLMTQVLRLGEDRAWEYLTALDRNVRWYATASSVPASIVGAGEALVGVTFVHDALFVQGQGQMVRFTYPPRTGWGLSTVSFVRGAPNPDGGRRFIDWLLTRRPQELIMRATLEYPVHPDLVPPRGLTPMRELDLLSPDLKILAAHRGRLVREWTRRFRSAPTAIR